MSKYLGLIFLIFLMACSEEQKPVNLIEKEKFVDVLTDIRIMEAAYGVSYSQKDSIKVSIKALYDSLFKARDLNEGIFLDSYRYYSRTSDELSSIEDMVMEKLTNKHLELEQKLNTDLPIDTLATKDSKVIK